VYLSIFVDTMGIAITIPVLPYYALAFGASALELGMLSSAYSGAQVIGGVAMGYMSDKYGRVPAIQLAFIGSAIGFALSAAAGSYGFLLFARVIGGLSGGSMPVAQAYIADVVSPAERSKYIGLTGATVGIAFTVGPGVGALLTTDAIGAAPEVILLIAAAFSLFSLGYATKVMEESLKETAGTKDAAGTEQASGLNTAQISLLVTRFVSMFGFTCMQTTYALLLLARWQYGSSTLGFVLLGCGFVIAGVQGGWGRIPAPHFERSAVAGCIILGLFLYLYALVEQFWLHVILFMIFVAGYAIVRLRCVTI
jgi:DHA1 family tetracycline resistance protein-like MFS transporter